ncbi:MAG: hypothetical protein V2A76_15335 [Planctomycetota bacterium]
MRQLLRLAPLLFLGLAGCGAEPAAESPFSGTGASELDGVVAVGHFKASALNAEWSPPALLNSVPEGADVTFLWLDAASYGGSYALLVSGIDPKEAARSLLRGGLLQQTGNADEFFMDLSLLLPGGLPALEAFRARNRLTGRAGGIRTMLKRYDRGDRLVLVPTVDLRDWLIEVSDRILRERSPSTAFAVALDGQSVARFIREQMQPVLGMMSMFEGFSPHGKEDPGPKQWFGLAGRLLLEAIDQMEGVVVTADQEKETRVTARLTPQADSPLSVCFEALEPLTGSFPAVGRVGGRLQYEVALDPAALADGLSRLAGPVLEETSPEFVKAFESDLAWARTSPGRRLNGFFGPEESQRLALSVHPGFQLDQLPLTLKPDLWTIWEDWVFCGEPIEELVPWSGESGCAARFWVNSTDPVLKVQASLIPGDRYLTVQFDMTRVE